MMHIKFSQITPLARLILRELKKGDLAILKAKEEDLIDLIGGVFRENIEEENRLTEDARKLLEANKKKIGLNIDEERALSMIKKQLAKERNFVL